jgi:hypothetical protein
MFRSNQGGGGEERGEQGEPPTNIHAITIGPAAQNRYTISRVLQEYPHFYTFIAVFCFTGQHGQKWMDVRNYGSKTHTSMMIYIYHGLDEALAAWRTIQIQPYSRTLLIPIEQLAAALFLHNIRYTVTWKRILFAFTRYNIGMPPHRFIRSSNRRLFYTHFGVP